jgi:hypothetical protein
MTTAISPITRQISRPYLSLQEFKNAPTALDYGNLVAGGNQAAQDAELTNAIIRASSAIDQYCNQILGATLDTEQQRTRVKPDGTVRFHPKYFPVVAMTDLQIGWTPNALTAVTDPSQAWFEEQEIIYPYAQLPQSMSSQGPLSFGFPMSSRAETFIKYTYVNGYANTLVSTSASAGATSIVCEDGLGVVAGMGLTIYDGANTERVIVASSYTFGSATIPLTAPLAYAHAVGVSVGSLPAAIKQAAILYTSAALKIRGDSALVMAVTNSPSQQAGGSQRVGSDIALAQEILQPFRRIR